MERDKTPTPRCTGLCKQGRSLCPTPTTCGIFSAAESATEVGADDPYQQADTSLIQFVVFALAVSALFGALLLCFETMK